MFENYFDKIGGGKVMADRVTTLFDLLTKVVPSTHVENVFVENSVSSDGTVTWGSLWFYGELFLCEFSNFLVETPFDVVRISQINRWACQTDEFQIGSGATESSKFKLSWWNDSFGVEMSAVGLNCDHLEHFFRTTILPNFLPN